MNPGLSSITDATGASLETTPVEDDYLPPGLHVDAAACYESVARLRERVGDDDRLLSGHMPEVLDHDAYPVG